MAVLNYILAHLAILQLLIPFLGALVIIPLKNVDCVRRVFQFVALSGAVCSSVGLYMLDSPASYALGAWDVPLGIEFYLDQTNQLLILYSYVILSFTAFAATRLFADVLEQNIESKYRHLIYSFILLYHFAALGIFSTNDLFNLYVFLEISSLAAYALFSIGRKGAAVAALEYLIVGTVAATFVLVGVGVIFSQTGHLNMGINKEWLSSLSSPIHYMALAFIMMGMIVKLSLFPFHYWLTRCYQYVSMPLLVYLPSISVSVSVYVIYKFIFYLIGSQAFYDQATALAEILQFIGISTILYCSAIAASTNNLRRLLSYSAVGQIGYIFIIFGSIGDVPLVISMLIADGIVKAVLFYAMALIAANDDKLTLTYLIQIEHKLLYAVCFVVILSSSLPLSAGFLLKLTMLTHLFEEQYYNSFIAVIVGSLLSLLYHYRIIVQLCFRQLEEEHNLKEFPHHQPYSVHTEGYEVWWLWIMAAFSFVAIGGLWL